MMSIARLNGICMLLTGAMLLQPSAILDAAPADPVISRSNVPITQVFVNPCNGDTIVPSGRVHTVSRVTFDGTGGYHAGMHINPHRVSGIGDISGAEYQVTGAVNFEMNGDTAPSE